MTVDSIVRLKLDAEHPDLWGAVELFINGEWIELTTGDRDDMEEMECDIAMAIEQGAEADLAERRAVLSGLILQIEKLPTHDEFGGHFNHNAVFVNIADVLKVLRGACSQEPTNEAKS